MNAEIKLCCGDEVEHVRGIRWPVRICDVGVSEAKKGVGGTNRWRRSDYFRTAAIPDCGTAAEADSERTLLGGGGKLILMSRCGG